MGIRVESRMRSKNPNMEEIFNRYRDPNGVLTEERIISSEADYNCGRFVRTSSDNGKTWSEWEVSFADDKKRHGLIANAPDGDELVEASPSMVYDPKSGCSVGFYGTHYYLRGHSVGYFRWWETGEDNWRPHPYFVLQRPNGSRVTRLLELEEGGRDFDPDNPRNLAFLDKNRGEASQPVLLSDGDIAFLHSASMRICCRLAGVDVSTWFPSCPDTQFGLLIGRLHWNEGKNDYDISYSNPIMLSDLQSSRGIMEPCMQELPNGRMLVVVRGSNFQSKVWHTRISPYAPGFKWYTVSYDGGRTFPPLMPWQFDDRSVMYSPASISRFFRSSKNGKLYWIGNIIEEPSRVDGNNPRWPLQIVEVDQTSGALKKNTLTVIDTIRDGQTSVELSNFSLLEDPDSGMLELRMTKENFNEKAIEDGFWYTEAWEYFISFDE